MLQVGIIGCGYEAQHHHTPGLAAIPDVRISAVCDLHKERAAALAERYQVPYYTTVEAMLESETLDIVDVVTREEGRPPILLACLAAGKHIFTEKPLAGADGQYCIRPSDLPAIHAIVDAWRQQGTMFGINFNLRQAAHAQRFKALIDSGELGDPVAMTAETGIGSTNHIIDLLRWVNGEVVEVSAVAVGPQRESTRCAHFTFANGSIGTLMRTPHADIFFRVQYVGTKARAIMQDIGGEVEIRAHDGQHIQRWKRSPLSAETYDSMFAFSIAHFIANVQANQPHAPNVLDGLRQAEIDAAITDSIERGQQVPVTHYLGV